jgi:hypothetical protein
VGKVFFYRIPVVSPQHVRPIAARSAHRHLIRRASHFTTVEAGPSRLALGGLSPAREAWGPQPTVRR